MRKTRIIYLLSILLTFALLSNLLIVSVYAENIDSFLVDNTTRWSFFSESNTCHMGSKYTTYGYQSQTVKENYSSYVTAGIAMWGSSISCVESGSSPMGTIKVSALQSTSTAVTSRPANPSTDHVSSWSITIYSLNFDSEINSVTGKNNTIAHEIGHVYGLGHVNNTTQIMYHTYSESKYVTSYDISGMNVMTHTHTHNSSYSTTLEQDDALYHKVRCNSCLAYHTERCSYTEFHKALKHYLVVDCSCGNNYTQSWDCTGNPCVTPLSLTPHYELE